MIRMSSNPLLFKMYLRVGGICLVNVRKGAKCASCLRIGVTEHPQSVQRARLALQSKRGCRRRPARGLRCSKQGDVPVTGCRKALYAEAFPRIATNHRPSRICRSDFLALIFSKFLCVIRPSSSCEFSAGIVARPLSGTSGESASYANDRIMSKPQ